MATSAPLAKSAAAAVAVSSGWDSSERKMMTLRRVGARCGEAGGRRKIHCGQGGGWSERV